MVIKMKLKKRMTEQELVNLVEQEGAKVERCYALDTFGTSGSGYVERRGLTVELRGIVKDYQIVYSSRGYGAITDDIIEYNGRMLAKYSPYIHAVNKHFHDLFYKKLSQ